MELSLVYVLGTIFLGWIGTFTLQYGAILIGNLAKNMPSEFLGGLVLFFIAIIGILIIYYTQIK